MPIETHPVAKRRTAGSHFLPFEEGDIQAIEQVMKLLLLVWELFKTPEHLMRSVGRTELRKCWRTR